MLASLVLVKVDGTQQVLPLRKSRLVVGRQEGCHIRLNSAAVSRQHCELAVDDAKVSVKDLGSSNGTYVNKRRVSSTDLAPGDVVCVGNFVFVLRVDGQPSIVDSKKALMTGMVVPGGKTGTPVAKPGAAAPQKTAEPLDGATSDSSSEWDFDFLGEGDKDRPKL